MTDSGPGQRDDPGQDRNDFGAERPPDDGPWPSYPDEPQPGYGPPQYQQPPQYEQPAQYGYEQPPQYQQPPQYGYEQPAQYGQPPAYGVNPYQQPPYAGYAPPNHPQATTALILGIVGLALCPFVGIAGFVMGGRVRREIDAAPGQWSGRGLATAGWVLGIISIVYAALLLVWIVVAVIVGVTSS